MESSASNRSTCLRYATLTREAVCTENLTPWSKLLPCSSKAGLAMILNALTLYDTSYHSLGIHIALVCDAEQPICKPIDLKLELKHTLTVVFDPLRNRAQRNWSIKSLFGRSVTSFCPLSDNTTVFIGFPSDEDIDFSPKPDRRVKQSSWVEVAEYELKSEVRKDGKADFNVAMKWKKEFSYPRTPKQSPLIAHSFVSGYGQESGSLHIEIANTAGHAINVAVLQLIPWYFRVYINTLSVELNKKPISISKQLNYIPAKDRVRPHTLEFLLDIPSQSTIHVIISFQKAFLKWTEHPPDSHHGFYIPSASVSFSDNSSAVFPCSSSVQQLVFTEPQLVILATPDFSMPYNVICFVCTIIAIAFGALHNLTTKQFAVESPDKPTKLAKLRQWVKSIVSRNRTELRVNS